MGRTLRYWHLAFALALAVRPIPLRAQPVPAGPEFQVNTDTTGHQSNPAVAAGPTGGFVQLGRGPALRQQRGTARG